MDNALWKYQEKICHDLEKLRQIISDARSRGQKVVLVSGTYDILHVGHGRYLSLAKSYGDRLIVGLDSDEKVKARKGPHRPIVDEGERAEMLSYLAAVNHIYIKPLADAKWALIRAVRPDVLVISKRSEYSESEINELLEICGDVIVLESQAETSTTARIRSAVIGTISPLLTSFEDLMAQMEAFKQTMEKITGVSQ